MKRNPAIVKELRKLVRNGVLEPARVVQAAEDPKSVLHDCFTWDDTEAARKHRLHEARMLINVHVEVLPSNGKATPVFVSLRSDRPSSDGGAYRLTAQVMSDDQMRAQLLRDAIVDMKAFKARYGMLKELSDVFSAIDSVGSKELQRGLR